MQNRYLPRPTRGRVCCFDAAQITRRIVTSVMPHTLLHTPARRRTAAFLLAAGTAFGILAASGLSSAAAADAHADSAPDVVVVAPTDAELGQVEQTLAAARTTLTDAAAAAAEVQDSGIDLGAESEAIGTDLLLPVLRVNVAEKTALVSTRTAALREHLNAAVAQRAAEEEAAAAAAALAAANTPDGAKAAARQIAVAEYGWGDDQFSCLSSLWQKESGWNYQAYNPSGATGIPQALPGGKMASAGSDWQTNATTQIRWGLGYIQSVYGTPCAAWGHSQATNWY
jgi:hypothetical protein